MYKRIPTDVYLLHRTALLPLLPNASDHDLSTACHKIKHIGEDKFLDFLISQGLGSFWHEKLMKSGITNLVSEAFINKLHQTRLPATGIYMLQTHALKKIKKTLDQASIPHVIFKGIHIRELIYDDPALRPACDIDVLISANQQESAIKALVDAGYQFTPVAENISHEATLVDGGISIDLHWDIMRPGRTRTPLADMLLETRTEYETHWGLDNEATLFLMLVHPVITKYATAPQSSLMRIVDLAYWIELQEIDWDKTLCWLDKAGLRTAAWIMLEWLNLLTQIETPPSFRKNIQPGLLRSKYLHFWIRRNLASRFLKQPLLIQVAFTLPAHDRFSDASHAITSLLREKSSAATETNRLKSNLSA